MIIGITGGIGSGKSTIARELSQRGFAVYDCDREAKRIIAENKDVQAAIIQLLGPETFREVPSDQVPSDQVPSTKVYNTAYVAQRVFADPALLQALNAIIHPSVKEDILSLPSTGRLGGTSVLFIESAILFEAGIDSLCDMIVLVNAPEDIRLERTLQRDYHGVASEENINKVRARIRAQRDLLADSYTQKKVLTVNNDGRTSIPHLADIICQYCAAS
jgi:dephospho-CoA kinase